MPRKNKVDLANVFQEVTQTLAANQAQLDQQDEINHDHGRNMVQNFQTITDALKTKRRSSGSAALNYAARQLSQSTASGSGKQYAENLAQAARQVKGKQIDPTTAMQLLQTLIGGGQGSSQAAPDTLEGLLGGQGSSQGQADPLQSLLGGLLGGGGSSSETGSQPGADLLGQLLGGLTGGGANSSGSQGGLSMQTLLRLGMAFMQARQSGKDVLPALIQAYLANSGMGNSRHRSQSTELVVNSYLQSLMDNSGRS